jgi:sensor histidine kinase YesM
MNRNDDQGRLFLTMKLMDDSILCEIIDNGVGREKARAIKSQKKINHQSAALPNINERLKMLQTQTNSIISIEIVDLFESGSPSGTMVKVLLPYQ